MHSVPEVRGAGEMALGFPDADLRAFCTGHRVPAIAATFEGRGDAERLASIAWWGSAIADIAIDPGSPRRNRILTEAAAFNLAVALFDTALDRDRATIAELSEALAPARMAARLRHPRDAGYRLRCSEPALDRVAMLFDAALSSAGCRLAASPALLRRLAGQLEQMYLSELQRIPDAFLAKTGPVIFIGALLGDEGSPARAKLYQAVALLCQEWDDWQDLAEDVCAFAPNAFLGAPRRLGGLGALPYSLRGFGRVLAGRALHGGIARRLAQRVGDAIARARECDVPTYRKTARLCATLVG